MDIEIGRCGIACEVCKNFKNVCLGCDQENQIEKICIIYECTSTKNVKYCFDCSEFPCGLLSISKSYCPKTAKIKLKTFFTEQEKVFSS